ncbi:signal peptidase I [Microbacterium sp. 179-I 3D4 NHS]|uniref:signal peptidase I n=1 Tax=Microbacterium sp. 179-I 3D4 NHS TaxID=3142381 RepID=UPI0039A077E7
MTRRDLREQAHAGALPRRGGGFGRMLADVVLWVAALGGVLCMLLVVLALTAQITLIMFSTGSMSPTIPAGSVAAVQRVPASEVRVGDVVTVDRPGELPVTHRVTSVAAGAGADDRVITMRGDANAADDPFPYPVSSVRRVLFAVPGVASVIVALGDPVVLGGITLAASALVVWAFWPRPARGSRATDAAGEAVPRKADDT